MHDAMLAEKMMANYSIMTLVMLMVKLIGSY